MDGFEEGFDAIGCIWYKHRVTDEMDGSGCDVKVFESAIKEPDSEPINLGEEILGFRVPPD